MTNAKNKNGDRISGNRQEVQLSDLLETIISSWQLIIGVMVASLLFGILYVAVVSPVYQVDVLMQVEQQAKGVGALAELSQIMQEESPVSAEFEIIRSRMVLGNVVDNLKLDITSRPVHFPLIGSVIARGKSAAGEVSEPWLGLAMYAWGGEKLHVDRFSVPEFYQGEVFSLVAGENNLYKLFDPEGAFLAEGTVGELLKIPLKGAKSISLFVSGLKSNQGTRFELINNSRLTSIERLNRSLKIVELGKQSGILRLNLSGTHSGKIKTILNEIANIYLRQSVERKSVEAENTLKFLDKQLPILKEKLESAEAALNNYRLKKGSVDLPIETKGTLDKAVSVDALLTELKSQREDLTRRFTPEHPRVAAIDAQIEQLNLELAKVDRKVKGLPGTQQEILRLTRNAQVNAELYTSLLNSSQELKVVKAGAVGNVRIVDYAVRPTEPIKPKKGLVIALSIVLGFLVGGGITFVRKSLSGAVQDPDIIERKLDVPILATVPFSKKQNELDRSSPPAKNKTTLLAIFDTDDLAIESIRSLRTSLYFAQLNSKSNILSVTSPGPGAGKSFISLNLAAVLACAGKQVLIIDADLRKGRVQEVFGIDNDLGLSDVIAGEVELNKVIRNTEIDNLDVITSGSIPNNPSEMLLHNNFSISLKIASEKYDQIIIDSPPVLAVTDATIIGQIADSTLLVVKDGQSPLREIEQSIKRLKQAGVNFRGVVYNGIKTVSSRYGYGKYYGYGYSYKKKKSEKMS